MSQFVEVSFRTAGQLFLFDAGSFVLGLEDRVVVETEHGMALGTVKVVHPEKPQAPPSFRLFPVIRHASKEDLEQEKRYKKREEQAFEFCRRCIEEHKLPMKLVRAEYLYSGSKLLFYFSADGRIDFRLLVRDLARHFRMRIEMRQIGVRDSAKLIGGVGPCGQELCCSRFLRNFSPVSIRMAKDQTLTLNPQKVSGVCGRLMCCLSYEQDMYQSVRKALPKVGRMVKTPMGEGRVRELLPLKESVSVVFMDQEPPVEKEFHLEQLSGYEGALDHAWKQHHLKREEAEEKQKRRPRKGIEPLMEPKGRGNGKKSKRAFSEEEGFDERRGGRSRRSGERRGQERKKGGSPRPTKTKAPKEEGGTHPRKEGKSEERETKMGRSETQADQTAARIVAQDVRGQQIQKNQAGQDHAPKSAEKSTESSPQERSKRGRREGGREQSRRKRRGRRAREKELGGEEQSKDDRVLRKGAKTSTGTEESSSGNSKKPSTESVGESSGGRAQQVEKSTKSEVGETQAKKKAEGQQKSEGKQKASEPKAGENSGKEVGEKRSRRSRRGRKRRRKKS